MELQKHTKSTQIDNCGVIGSDFCDCEAVNQKEEVLMNCGVGKNWKKINESSAILKPEGHPPYFWGARVRMRRDGSNLEFARICKNLDSCLARCASKAGAADL